MSNWYPRTRLWIWRLPFIMKEFTKTYPSQKMGIDFFLQIVVTKASVHNYTYRYTYICYYCTSPDRLNRQQLIIRKKTQWFSKNQKFIVEILEIRYIRHQIILLSNVFILLQFTQFKKKSIWQQKSAKHARLLQYRTFFCFQRSLY